MRSRISHLCGGELGSIWLQVLSSVLLFGDVDVVLLHGHEQQNGGSDHNAVLAPVLASLSLSLSLRYKAKTTSKTTAHPVSKIRQRPTCVKYCEVMRYPSFSSDFPSCPWRHAAMFFWIALLRPPRSTRHCLHPSEVHIRHPTKPRPTSQRQPLQPMAPLLQRPPW